MSACPSPIVEDCQLLTPAQEAVICLISAGSTIVAAAEAAGVHRNTILSWRRNSAHFRLALRLASEEKALFWRDQTEQLAAAAVEALRSMLADPTAPASVRLKAALHVLDRACAPPQAEQELDAAPAPDPGPAHETARILEKIVHNSAQFAQHLHSEPPALNRPAPKIGRDDDCPCGSGKKYKRCCIGKTAATLGSPATESAQIARAVS